MKIKIENLDLVHKTRVEMIPLVDVIFLLLVFFIYSMFSMTIHRGLKVNLPGAQAAYLNKNQDHYTVSIDIQGNLFFEKEAVSKQQLLDRLKTIKNYQNKTFFIDADKNVAYKKVVSVLNSLRSLNIKKVSLSTVS
ncbi:ExbD/TolR family protein [Candidatus Auribacterota bacterium]